MRDAKSSPCTNKAGDVTVNSLAEIIPLDQNRVQKGNTDGCSSL